MIDKILVLEKGSEIKWNEWPSENNNKIEVFFLPPYSPELYPQEYVNQDVKTNVIGKTAC